jgi:hypothetical protein
MQLLHSLACAITITCVLTAGTSSAQDEVFKVPHCTPLPFTQQMHGAAVVGNRLYTFGGDTSPGGWSNAVYSAPIQEGGMTGSWRQELVMPERRHYIASAVEVVNNRIYISGGAKAPAADSLSTQLINTKDVLWTTVKPDGTLNEWNKSLPFEGSAVYSAASSSNDTHLFVTGGADTGVVSRQVRVAEFSPNGSPQNWKEQRELPVPLWFHGAAIMEEDLYVWGGLPQNENENLNRTIYRARVAKDGSLGEWQEAGNAESPVYSAIFCGFNDFLISICGRYTKGYPTNAIWYGRVSQNKVASLDLIKTDLRTRVYHAAGIDESRGVIYIVGGRFRPGLDASVGNPLNSVQAFQLPRASPEAAGTQKGFLKIPAALAEAQKSGRRVLAVFHSPQVPAASRLWTEVLTKKQFRDITTGYVLAESDVADTQNKDPYEFSIFKVPCLAILSGKGSLVVKDSSIRNMQDVEAFLRSN